MRWRMRRREKASDAQPRWLLSLGLVLWSAASAVIVSGEADEAEGCEDAKTSAAGSCRHANEVELEDSGPMDTSLNRLDQKDPQLAQAVKEKFLFPPPSDSVPYNFSKKAGMDLKGQYGQTEVIQEIFDGRWPKSGFFIEAGAYDGEFISNSLLFELKYGWTGVLVEPNPDNFEELQMKHRKAWTLNNCLSTKPAPETVEFDAFGLWGGIVNKEGSRRPADSAFQSSNKRNAQMLHYPEKGLRRLPLRIRCLPLYSVLAALGNPTVHYLVLDIEGAEMDVLKTIPWDKVDIKVVEVETVYLGHIFEGGSQKKLDKFMKKAGYVKYRVVDHDTIYVREDFLPEEK